jgi:hypothetical protein
LHACDSGIMLNLAEVAYGGLTQASWVQSIWTNHMVQGHHMPIYCPVRIALWDNKEELWQPHSLQPQRKGWHHILPAAGITQWRWLYHILTGPNKTKDKVQYIPD